MKAKKIHEVLDQATRDFQIHDYCEVKNAISLESIRSAKKKDKMYYSDLRDLAKWITTAKECCSIYRNAVGDTNMLFVAGILAAELKSEYGGFRVKFNLLYNHAGKTISTSSNYLSSIEHGLMECAMSLADYHVTDISFQVSIIDRGGCQSFFNILPNGYVALPRMNVRNIFAKDAMRQYSVIMNITKEDNKPEEEIKMKKVKVTKVTKTSMHDYEAGDAPVNSVIGGLRTDDSATVCNENASIGNVSPANASIDALGYTWTLSAEKAAHCGNTQPHRWDISLTVIDQQSGETKLVECACSKELSPAIFHMEDLSYNARKVHSMLDAMLDYSSYRYRYFNSKRYIPYIGTDIRPLPGDNWSTGTVSVISSQIVICELMIIDAFLAVCGVRDNDTELDLFMKDVAVRDILVNVVCKLVYGFIHALYPNYDYDMECGDCDHDCDDCDCDCNEH